MKPKTSATAIILAIVIAAVCWYFTACASFREAWSPANRSATVAQLKKDAVAFIGGAAMNLAQSYVAGNDIATQDAIAAALWKTVSVGNIAAAVEHAGGTSAEGRRVEALAYRLKDQTPGVEYDVINGIASAVSAYALEKRGLRHD